MLTFGQYNTLAATRHHVTLDQLTAQTAFDDLMVKYYVAGLLASSLITASTDGRATSYELTEAGRNCLTDYERHNPELTVARPFKLELFS